MNELGKNPYSPLEINAPAASALPSRLRYVPGLFFVGIGGMVFLVALFLCIVVTLGAGFWFEDENGPYYKGVLHALTWLFVGTGWISAGAAFLFARYRLGSFLAVAMLAIFLIHFPFIR